VVEFVPNALPLAGHQEGVGVHRKKHLVGEASASAVGENVCHREKRPQISSK